MSRAGWRANACISILEILILKYTLRARKIIGTFEKRAQGHENVNNDPKEWNGNFVANLTVTNVRCTNDDFCHKMTTKVKTVDINGGVIRPCVNSRRINSSNVTRCEFALDRYSTLENYPFQLRRIMRPTPIIRL